MSTMKSKLAASVRQVKTQAPAPSPSKAARPAKNPAVKPQADAAPTIGQPVISGGKLFPSRIWPD